MLLSAAVQDRLHPANASLTRFPGGPSCSHAAPFCQWDFWTCLTSGSLSNSTSSFVHPQASLLRTLSCSSGVLLVIFGHSAPNSRRRLVFRALTATFWRQSAKSALSQISLPTIKALKQGPSTPVRLQHRCLFIVVGLRTSSRVSSLLYAPTEVTHQHLYAPWLLSCPVTARTPG